MRSEYTWEIKNKNIPSNIGELIETLILSRKTNESDFDLNIVEPGKFVEKYVAFFANAKNATKEIEETIERNLPIIIHGDYDVDGQTATSILWRTIFHDLGYKNVFPYIPNRFDEGYGLSEESLNGMKKLLESKNFAVQNEKGKALIVTVDCGITAIKEVKLAKEIGFKIIISDHHHEADKLPEPDHLVWTTNATGAGIAWVLSYLLRENFHIKNSYNFDRKKYLDLAALGTICDLQPLLDLNRSISKYGLERINQEPTLGLKVLKDVSEIKTNIETYHLGWIIGPKLNATGRLESAMDALRILCTEDFNQASDVAKNLDSLNKERQDKTLANYEHAYSQVNPNIKDLKFIIAKGENYHEGVIGLVAGKLVQTFYKPSIVISIDKKTGLAKGSARSIEGISIIESLNLFSDLFEKVGGHDMAAGFTIKESNIEKLNEALNSLDKWEQEVFIPKLKIDSEIKSNLINLNSLKEIQKLSPFGPGNREPIFLTKNLKVFNITTFGKENNHLKMFLIDNNDNKFNGLIFNAPQNKNITLGDNMDVVYKLSLNEWNGNKNIELSIQDFKPSNA